MRTFFHYTFYSLFGLLLIPSVAANGVCLYRFLVAAQMEEGSAGLLIWFFGGMGIWIVIFTVLPRPFRTYVLAHELSHALWAWMMGARVGKLKVGKNGGSVVVSETNLFITLAPYFFPFYTFLLLVSMAVATLFVDLSPWQSPIAGLLGASWAFHLSFTLLALATEQSDIHAYGKICAYPFILFANLLIVNICLLTLAPLSLQEGYRLWLELHTGFYQIVLNQLQELFG